MLNEPKSALPVRMLNEYAYCPRLFYLEWVQGEWRDNADTLDGSRVHERVDQPTARGLAEAEESGDQHARSVHLSDPELNLVAKIDLVEAEGELATPIDYKRGKRPDIPAGAYEPERVQVCAQGLLLRRHGFKCEKAFIYFVSSKQRVEVELTDELVARTLALRDEAIAASALPVAPPPLVDSPKCNRCSLASICLPDEHNAVVGRATGKIRTLIPPRDDALPFHAMEHGAQVCKEADELVVRVRDQEVGRARLLDISRVNLHGSAFITMPALREVLSREIPVALYSHGGYYYGRVEAHPHKNVYLRLAQFRAATNAERSLLLARRFVSAKIRNCRVLLRRNHRALPVEVLDTLRELASKTERAEDLPALLGVEGYAARVYFEHFSGMLGDHLDGDFSFDGRNRRPPRDPVNALLSFCYALLTSEWTATLSAIGFDPYLGFYHQPHYGRPALALDLMEEFRPIIADSTVINVINNNVVTPDDFYRSATSVVLRPAARKRVIQTFERRMDELITHPVFGYRISYRRTLDVQARLLGRYLLGEIDTLPEFVTR